MDRDEALESVQANVDNANLVKHMLATEAVMRALAARLGEDVEEWGLTGLLHDIDVELTEGDADTHSRLGADLVRELGASEEVARAVLVHNEAHGVEPESALDRALVCADPLTGLVIAATLVLPDKKLASLKASSVSKRFKEKGFAAGASREQMARCTELGLQLEELIELGVKAMQGIAPDLGL